MRPWLVVLALGVFASACSLFTDTEGLSGSVPDAAGPADGSADATIRDSTTDRDGGSSADAAADASSGDAADACPGVFCDGFERGSLGGPCLGWQTLMNASTSLISTECHGGGQCCEVCVTGPSYNGAGEFRVLSPLAVDAGGYQVSVWLRAENDGGVLFLGDTETFLHEDGGYVGGAFNNANVGTAWLSVTASAVRKDGTLLTFETLSQTYTYPYCYVVDDVRVFAQ